MHSADDRTYVVAHSQATIHLTNAELFHGGLPQGSTFAIESPAIPQYRVDAALRHNNANANSFTTRPWFEGANTWGPSLNPLKFLSGLLDFPMGLNLHTNNNKSYQLIDGKPVVIEEDKTKK